MRRLMLGLSQEKLAEAVGVSYQQMQKYEKGVNRISPSRLQHIAQVLQVTPPFFFEGLPDSTKGVASPFPDYLNELLATRDGLELIKGVLADREPKPTPRHRRTGRADRAGVRRALRLEQFCRRLRS
jgi:transcriptional regulator with XRE-family HTH domain